MKHELPKLSYNLNDLGVAISERTMEFHYGKHHQGYVNNLNNLIPGTKFENASLEQIIIEADGGIYNNGAQVWNHTFYFEAFSPNPKEKPEGELLRALESNFGSFEKFIEDFSKAAATLFGSGWAWLVVKNDGKLSILQESNAGNPLRNGYKPLLTCDVWEHAYYLDYQNRRPDYVKEFWKILDWKVIEERFQKLK
ncbi:MAG: superoxide dismutase, Fe-Mn family [Tenuifilum sp.]|jgi:Fe-Mn family superoxide dismutase|uniref:superoxide dismutase n=1 Tax=Tenuifilum sp. TaxID=2760880 RepID=UPI0024AC5BDE|nr:superoxide dismutase [Tenuifilum sp.]MDI3526571.1 superoxide dismutase, Fe-Mn family [Tenuifilum sp.]